MDFKQPPRRSFKPATPKPPVGPPRPQQPIPPTLTTPQTPTAPETSASPVEPIGTTEPKTDFRLKDTPKKRSKKKLFFIFSAIILVLGASLAAYWFLFKPKAVTVANGEPAPAETQAQPEKKPDIVSPLTGVKLSDASLVSRPVTGIMIENSPEARPQSGLTEAGIVYEAIAEGGITRFLAVYQDTHPNYIGPVRSARPYYIDFIAPYDASYAHVGGSPEALQDIKSLNIKDLDQFYNPSGYVRITERYAPHNVYTGFDKLDKLNQTKGYTSSKFTPFVRKPDVPQTPTARIIDFSISAPLYSPRFEYDTGTNTYKRSQGGEAHIDQKSKAQISPKVVIALVTEKGYDPDGYHTDYKTSGSGKMYVFQDGIVSEGTWQKANRKSAYVFTDKNGFPMKLNTGQTWISLVANQSDVTYKP